MEPVPFTVRLAVLIRLAVLVVGDHLPFQKLENLLTSTGLLSPCRSSRQAGETVG
ncbi:MAG: hypothetical protein JXA44_13180 [Methanospirillaceae archaeon]|nr:hypothetical protein [Methanospirillaceae archaeon]